MCERVWSTSQGGTVVQLRANEVLKYAKNYYGGGGTPSPAGPCAPAGRRRQPPVLRLVLALVVFEARGTSGFGVVSLGPLSANVTDVADGAAFANIFRWTARRPMLRYAIDPDFCSAMQPLLSEATSWTDWLPFGATNFSGCERLERAIHDAFDNWQRASPALQFVDVSGRCSSERLWTAIPEEHCTMSPLCERLENATSDLFVDWTKEATYLEQRVPPPSSDECSHRTCWECPRADVIVGAFSQKNRNLGDQHARARVIRSGLTQMRPVGADGKPKPGGYVGSAKLQFNSDHKYMDSGTVVDKCWKLESDVCDWVALPSTSDAAGFFGLALTLILIILSCCCCCAFCICLRNLAYNMLAGYDLDSDGKLSFQELTYVLDEFIGDACFNCRCPQIHGKDVSIFVGTLTVVETIASVNILYISLSCCGIIFVIFAYGLELSPCLVCWDLPAAAAHEIGHLLSLEHPASSEGIVLNLLNASEFGFPPPPPPPPDLFVLAGVDNTTILPPAQPPPSPPPTATAMATCTTT